jgi:hypothetical protein
MYFVRRSAFLNTRDSVQTSSIQKLFEIGLVGSMIILSRTSLHASIAHFVMGSCSLVDIVMSNDTKYHKIVEEDEW